ncbi:hypothetical protein MIND_00952700 [Mycena indigotica]|uniref:Uncharacterized protein n=1 Tax=Mycena indigotica TaxID=2126181 RepID=A0A8H6VZ53_9AGAR|nr:uncharacterized protein MIND_00952700 [Mycena indigotica]KAF7297196.1 hypothetical protein MIND_00952700 [Mycena indigotica]
MASSISHVEPDAVEGVHGPVETPEENHTELTRSGCTHNVEGKCSLFTRKHLTDFTISTNPDMASNVPSIRLIVPTPDVSAATDPNSSIASRVPTKKKSVLSMFSGSVSSNQTPYNTVRDAGDFSDIVRRVGEEGSVSGRGWQVHVDNDNGEATVRRQSAEGEGMVLIKKKTKQRGKIDGVFTDTTNTRSESPQVPEASSKDKWWTLSRGRKDTGGKDGKVLGLMRRGKSPGPSSLPPTPTLDVPQRQHRSTEMQMHLPGEPDCTLDMVEVPSLRGRAVVQDLPQQFPVQKRFNSLGASSSLAPPTVTPRTEFQRSVSAGSAALLAHPQYAHMPGASTPYATMTRLDTYQQPENAKPKPPQRSASAMGVYSVDAPPEFKRSLSALAGSGIVLGAPASTLGRAPTPTPLSRAPTPIPGPRSGTPQPLLSVPGKEKDQGSIALRAMKSMRSMARLGNWGDEKEEVEVKKIKAKDDEKEKKKKKKEKEKEKDKKKDSTRRQPKSSGSSFEIGALGASPVQRKRSILGLGLGMSGTLGKGSTTGIGMGLPSSLSLGRSAGGKASTASSVGGSSSGYAPHANPIINPNRLSADAPGVLRRDSTNSSLRPISVLSSESSSGSRVSSGSSVRWAEEVVDKFRTKKDKRDSRRDSKHSLEGRKRTPLSDVFPSFSRRSSASESINNQPPMLTVEEATTDGHGGEDDEDVEMEDDFQIVSATPIKRRRPRPRPVSDDMIDGASRPRPRGIVENNGSSTGGVLNMLDAATNDLAQLITFLELDATPSPARDAIVPPVEESPIGKNKSKVLRPSEGSVSSLRPYAERAALSPKRQLVPKASQRQLIGQQIAPWPTALESTPPAPISSDATFKRSHRRTMTPSPEPDPAPVFHPLRLRPSRIRPVLTAASSSSPSPPPSSVDSKMDMRAPSSLTFGSRSSSDSPEEPQTGRVLPPVFTRHTRNRSSLLPDAQPSPRSSKGSNNGMPLARGAKRVLGMAGTLGGSHASDYEEQELDASDPDSDIPNELQVILSASRATSPVDDTLSFFPSTSANTSLPSPGLPPGDLPPLPPSPRISSSPPQLQLPIFNVELVEDDGNHADIDDGATSEEDTKKSFDFTGELQKLNESGASDRRSFVEQLETAFKTPAKIDLRNLLAIDVPPVPPMQFIIDQTSSAPSSPENWSSLEDQRSPRSATRLMDITAPTIAASEGVSTRAIFEYPEYPSPIIDLKEPTLLPGSDSLGSDISLLPQNGPSTGELNIGFKFGGQFPEEEPASKMQKEPLTLSNILPPASHSRAHSLTSLMEDEESVLKSILAHAADIAAQPRPRVNSDSSLRRSAIGNSRASMASMHSRTRSRPASGTSFTGFDSFDEVRRGFEFHANRPTFYPPPPAARNTRAYHGQHDSVFSIASVSSYGHVTNPGVNDPFEYGLPMPSLREQPSSEDLSISLSMNVDDTFSFLARDPRRKRVASDASSFYFKAPAQQSQTSRGHRHRESTASIASQNGPPVSFYNYNRSYASHRLSEADSSTSGSSLAHQYASQGATGGRAAWARHQHEPSTDSILSDFSVARLGRPGVGDKMFDTAYDQGAALSSISASPPEYDRPSYDSIMGEQTGRGSSMEDSLFDKTGHRSSMSSDSIFGYDDHHPPNGHLLPPNQFRPLSMLSMNMSSSTHSPMKEDDTMITMLGGGHVRRRSIGSVFEASPCVRVEKRKHATLQEEDKVAHKARIMAQPSIASTSSSKFGEERMIRAKQGLLVRQSLEESALIGDGEIGFALRQAPVFSRPSPNSRSRSSTITTSSSGAETPPLSSAEYSSMSDGSQSSIDISELNFRLVNTTHPVPNPTRRARARGNGHRRRMSAAQSRASRASVYETIHEELASPAASPESKKSNNNSPTAVFVVPADSGSMDWTPGASMGWDDERGIIALRKYYALRNEAEDAVIESKRTWLDTPFSLFALQSFEPPKNHEGMQALLQHSVESYGPLPYELGHRRVRSRTSSRPSPYPSRQVLSQQSPNTITNSPRPSPDDLNRAFMSPALQSIDFDPNVDGPSFSMMSPLGDKEKNWGLPTATRPRVPSAARRSALGWAKRSTKASSDLKENNLNNSAISFIMSPNESLRISRPRPRGRPTPARRQAVPVA